jgi:hypothetical protein
LIRLEIVATFDCFIKKPNFASLSQRSVASISVGT